MTETVVVTGAGGFIGRHLTEHLLENGRKVIAVDVDLQSIRHLEGSQKLMMVEEDIQSSATLSPLLKDADVIYHLAAAHLDVLQDEAYYRSINVDAVSSLLSLAATGKVRRFVHCSSVGVYGSLQQIPADESTPCRPEIAYERTKLAGEQAVREAVKSSALSAVIVRPSWVYGPGCPRTMKLIRSVVNRRFFFAGRGENLRHPIYVTDLLTAFDLATTAEVPSGEVIVVAGPAAVTTRDLVNTILELTGSRFRPPVFPFWFVAAGCYALEKVCAAVGRHPPFSSRSLKFFSENSSFSIEKAQRLLGFDPRVSLEEGLMKTIQYGKEHQLI